MDDDEEVLPNLEDLLPSLQKKSAINDNMTDVISNPIDIQTLNLPKIMEKVNIYRHDNKIRKSGRRQAHVPIKHGVFIRGTNQRTRRKICDLMLQTIYMARHKIKQMAGDKYFKITDTGYRVAFLFRRISDIMKSLLSLYWTMHKNRYDWADIRPYLILHHKAWKLHIDFNDLWWVLVRLDGAFRKGDFDEESDNEELREQLAAANGSMSPGEFTPATNKGGGGLPGPPPPPTEPSTPPPPSPLGPG